MVNLRGPFRYLRICFEIVLLILVPGGINIFPWREFAYNNSYHFSIQMAPFEALYGQRCRLPIGWFDIVVVYSLDTNLLRDAMEQVRLI